MSDRFYSQMIQATGWAPGFRNTSTRNEYELKFGKTRRKRMAWDDAKKAQAVEMYQEQEPTPDTSVEIVKDIAEELGESPNGVRMILTKAGVYVRKNPVSTSSKSNGNGGGRVSVADAQAKLTSVLVDAGQNVDEAIIAKLTGKAAVYFANIVENIHS